MLLNEEHSHKQQKATSKRTKVTIEREEERKAPFPWFSDANRRGLGERMAGFSNRTVARADPEVGGAGEYDCNSFDVSTEGSFAAFFFSLEPLYFLLVNVHSFPARPPCFHWKY